MTHFFVVFFLYALEMYLVLSSVSVNKFSSAHFVHCFFNVDSLVMTILDPFQSFLNSFSFFITSTCISTNFSNKSVSGSLYHSSLTFEDTFS